MTLASITLSASTTIAHITQNNLNPSINFTATALDSNGNSISGVGLYLIDETFGQYQYMGQTDSNGQISSYWNFSTISGNEIFIAGNTSYNSTIKSNQILISVSQVVTVTLIILQASAMDTIAGQDVTFTATAFTSDGSEIAGLDIYLIEKTTMTTTNLGKTNQYSQAVGSFKFNSGGKFVFVAANAPTKPTIESGELTITVIAPNSIVLQASTTMVTPRAFYYLTATYYNENAKPARGETIYLHSFNFNFVWMMGTTNSSGKAFNKMIDNWAGMQYFQAWNTSTSTASTIRSNVVIINGSGATTTAISILGSIQLIASTTNAVSGQPVIFTATAYTTTNTPMEGVLLWLVDESSKKVTVMETTGSNGQVVLQKTINTVGFDTFVARNTSTSTSFSIVSNPVTIGLAPTSTEWLYIIIGSAVAIGTGVGLYVAYRGGYLQKINVQSIKSTASKVASGGKQVIGKTVNVVHNAGQNVVNALVKLLE